MSPNSRQSGRFDRRGTRRQSRGCTTATATHSSHVYAPRAPAPRPLLLRCCGATRLIFALHRNANALLSLPLPSRRWARRHRWWAARRTPCLRWQPASRWRCARRACSVRRQARRPSWQRQARRRRAGSTQWDRRQRSVRTGRGQTGVVGEGRYAIAEEGAGPRHGRSGEAPQSIHARRSLSRSMPGAH